MRKRRKEEDREKEKSERRDREAETEKEQRILASLSLCIRTLIPLPWTPSWASAALWESGWGTPL